MTTHSHCAWTNEGGHVKITAPLRRALIYGAISYGGLVLINNAELNLPNMWIAYLPMFVGVYVLTQWLDRTFGS